jgi:hypothetical protein
MDYSRFKTEEANTSFVRELRKYEERTTVLKQIDVLNDQLNKARREMLFEWIDPADFKIMKADCEKRHKQSKF